MNNTNTYSLLWGFKLPIIQKIALSGLFIAIACILNKVVAINYISAVPFVRVSFGGPAIIIFASILLGPIYGGLVGGLSDILGYFIFDIKAFPWFPSITSTYFVLGAFACLFFSLFLKLKSKKISMIITYAFMAISLVLISLFLILNDDVNWFSHHYQIHLWMKIVFPLLMAILFVGLILFNYFINKSKRYSDIPFNVYQITFSCFLIELLIMTLYGSLMKAVAFGMDLFMIIFFCQLMTMFFNIPFNVIILSLLLKISKKYYAKESV